MLGFKSEAVVCLGFSLVDDVTYDIRWCDIWHKPMLGFKSEAVVCLGFSLVAFSLVYWVYTRTRARTHTHAHTHTHTQTHAHAHTDTLFGFRVEGWGSRILGFRVQGYMYLHILGLNYCSLGLNYCSLGLNYCSLGCRVTCIYIY
jgi:hypothetical protein